eukprot:288107_1
MVLAQLSPQHLQESAIQRAGTEHGKRLLSPLPLPPVSKDTASVTSSFERTSSTLDRPLPTLHMSGASTLISPRAPSDKANSGRFQRRPRSKSIGRKSDEIAQTLPNIIKVSQVPER